MTHVPAWRLYLFRAGYLLIGVGLISMQLWPTLFSGLSGMKLMSGTVEAMLWALAVLSFLGVRYPIQMLPLLFIARQRDHATRCDHWIPQSNPHPLLPHLAQGLKPNATYCYFGIFTLVSPTATG